jgi:hypothetical protein
MTEDAANSLIPKVLQFSALIRTLAIILNYVIFKIIIDVDVSVSVSMLHSFLHISMSMSICCYSIQC